MIQKRKILLFITIFILTAAIGYFVYHFRIKLLKVLTPIVMAIIIAYLLSPLVNRLKRKKIPCSASILLVYGFFSMLIAAVVIFIVPELINNTKELMNTLPAMTDKYQNMFGRVITSIQSSKWSPDMKNTIFNEIQSGSAALQRTTFDILRRTLSGMVQTITTLLDMILAMIIAYYIMKDSDVFKESTLSLVPRSWRNWLIATGREINRILSNFIQGQVLTALIVGILETMGLFIIGTKYPMVLGLAGGMANIIPYFGPIIGAIPAIAVALIDSPTKALWTALVFVVVQQIDNAFISPKIIEGRLGLHPVSTIVAVLVGGEFFGIIGMFVAVPILAVIKAIIKRAVEVIA